MRALGVSGGWMFFEHVGAAVAVNLTTGDVTDVFDTNGLAERSTWTAAPNTDVERRATLLARSALAADVDPLRTFRVPDTVRASARQALQWQHMYGRSIPLPIVASAVSLVPPRQVREAAQHALTDTLDAEARARVEQLCSGRAVSTRLVNQMHIYFSRHPQTKVPTNDWLSWGGDPGRTWADRMVGSFGQKEQSLVEKLAEAEEIDYDTLRLLPRAFSVVASPHTVECEGMGQCTCGGSKESAQYPSERALAFLGLGGNFGRDWANRVLRRYEAKALRAATPPPPAEEPPAEDAEEEAAPAEEEAAPDETSDQSGQDGSVPHVYASIPEFPAACMYCGMEELHELHQEDAVDYQLAEITPGDAHHYTERHDDPDACAVCGNDIDDTLHKQAALAGYYLYKSHIDAELAANKEFWAGQDQGVTAGGAHFGVDWIEDEYPDERDAFDRAEEIDAAVDQVFWQRRGTEDDDPLTYYVGHTGDDQMLVDQLYVFDGSLFYQYLPQQQTWEQANLASPAQLYEVDDETALSVIRALSVFPGERADLREVDPGEALLMEECLPSLDHEMLERTAIVTASASMFVDDGYTPEERAANAKKQVRDAGGRFAKSGSKIAVGPDARTGTVTKINPETQQVEVAYDDGGEPEWVDAKSTRVTGPPESPQPQTLDTRKIVGKPRATANTPKALLPTLLPPMDAESIAAVVENYPNFIAKERAGAAARKAAQEALDDKARQRAEADQAKAEAEYKRRLEKIQAKGKKVQDWIDKIYRKILPAKYRRAAGLSLLAAGTPITDPAQSDVAPVYMAEVDEANQQSVLELLAMVPASSEGTDAQLLRYTATGWVNDPKILRQLRSSSPPAIVALDEATFNDTLEQVKTFYTTPQGKAEAEQEAKAAESKVASGAAIWGEYGELVEIVAAGIPGIADTPSDIAATEKLKRYWTVGKGGVVKIRWNTPGDMTRCMRHLRKYMPRPDMHAGYCAKLHHEMTGTWPGDRNNIGRRGAGARFSQSSVHLLSTDDVIDFSALVAGANALCAGVEAPSSVLDVPTELAGAPFVIPVLAPIGVKSGDGRHFAPLSLTTRDLPLPLMWQIQTQEGHDASVIVGRIDSIGRAEDGSLVDARGVFDVGPYGQEAERLVRHKFLRGVSVDLDEFEATAKSAREMADDMDDADSGIVRIRADDMTVTNGRVMGATLVAKPAFQQCTIELEEGQEEETMVADGTYIGTPESEAETEEMIRSALTAAGIPVHPPKDWFADPGLNTETPLTVLDDGRVYGHVATWDSDHIGLPFSTRPPKSRSNYAYFHTGVLRTDDGSDVPVGQITLAGGHASLEMNAAAAVEHYDNTASAVCDVHAGEDLYGIWVAGALRPDVSAEQVRAMRASAPSGDWRPIHGRLELVAVCQVNVPGFPVTRARVASGHVYALVAAGTAMLSQLRAAADAAPLDKLIERVDALEAPQREALNAAREAALARINPVREEQAARLYAAREAARNRFIETRSPEAAAVRERVAALLSDDGSSLFRDYSKDTREEMAKKGQAMPGGGYPIGNVSDLKNAIRAYGRAASGEKAAVRRHIKKRARALGKTDLIPESWASLSDPFSDLAGEINDLAARLAMVSGATSIPIILHGDERVLDNVELLASGGRYPDGTPWNPENHPRDEKGKFRQVIAELKSDLEGEVGTEQAVEGLKEIELQANQGDTEAAQQAARDVLELVDKMAGATQDEDLVKTLREGYGSLAEAVANLPLVFGDLNEKYKFSELPDDLQSLIKDLYTRAETRLDPEHLQEAGGKLAEFMAGGDVLSQPQISAELSRILRFLI